MKQNISFIKVEPYIYKLVEDEDIDDSMFTLYLGLTDGLGMESYVAFLENKAREEFYGNMISMLKHGKMVTVTVDEDIIPDLPTFTTTIDKLITMFKEKRRFEDLGVDRIEINLENDHLSISGDWIN